ncbi:MAG: aminopeptidase [Bacteroidetes bacterium]|nr:aminopeptidase [Bacteroidota bacterium]
MAKRWYYFFILALVFFHNSCVVNDENRKKVNDSSTTYRFLEKDVHSFSNPNQNRVEHLHLNLEINFDEKILSGSVLISIARLGNSNHLHLDSKDLVIHKVLLDDGDTANYSISPKDSILGQDLTIDLKSNTKSVEIFYETSPESEALQWLNPKQTYGKVYPFLFSQSQAILARSWVPCQDSPGIKFTYSADIGNSLGLLVLMSAQNPVERNESGRFHFEMDQPISTYLLAIACGNIKYQALDSLCGVYAESEMLEASSWELASLPQMIKSAESLYGKYVWKKYDVLILPPSFPFGGMENPRLTFATPTIIAGDRSLVSLIAHELAHSWSGNLVTNETWNDFWLNEGFTVYFEQRIMESIYGKRYVDMLNVLGMDELKHTISDLLKEDKSEDTHLFLNLKGRNPDDGLTDVAYEKGRYFLQTIEQIVGRKHFDSFLKKYFTENSFQPMNTKRFIQYLKKNLLNKYKGSEKKLMLERWVYGPGIPSNCTKPYSEEFNRVDSLSALFSVSGDINVVDTAGWTTHHWLRFLRSLKESISKEQVVSLEHTFHLSYSGNSEILCDWFQLCIITDFQPAFQPLETFLITVGRRKFLSPIYKLLSQTTDHRKWGRKVFVKAKPGYHSITSATISEILMVN